MKSLIYICNAIEDTIRIERQIDSDSPACSRKVFLTCDKLSNLDVKVYVLSLGRGQIKNKFIFHKAKVVKKNNFIIIYAPFNHLFLLSYLSSLFFPLILIKRLLSNVNAKDVVLFYWNRTIAYLPILFYSKIKNIISVLDLEDGNLLKEGSIISKINARFSILVYDYFCNKVVTTNTQLLSLTKIKQKFCFYGIQICEDQLQKNNFDKLRILFSGSITKDTGAILLYNTIKKLRLENISWKNRIEFHITGKGDELVKFEELQLQAGNPKVIVHGRLKSEEYIKVLKSCNIGLALKLPDGPLANTTFPSKILEYLNEELLIMTTDISDVRFILNDNAIYTTGEIEDIINKLKFIIQNISIITLITRNAKTQLKDRYSINSELIGLYNFLFKNNINAI
jgi:hypothetical protein